QAGSLLKAKQYARQAIRFCARAGASLSEATALLVLAKILSIAGQRDGVIEAMERAQSILLDLDPERAGQVAAELRLLSSEIELPEARTGSPVLECDPEAY
ncbi:hypothetical protein, partial [Lentzea sp.]|uniref:hypothetical protein n=1 Tax=Lentzea sp. TaxID=56099 RepID=UPI002ED14164